ncbi:MAG: FAD-dependent oxidoreductase [Lachnospiraceae bacterium]|nr:FAD-dependent oxidoreductase [Lachnospiraceae bacterium]
MLRINQLKLPIHHSEEELKEKIFKILKVNGDQIVNYKISKQSIDARKKPTLFYVYTIDVQVYHEKEVLRKSLQNVMIYEEKTYIIPKKMDKKSDTRPIIIGFGPTGIFSAYLLAKCGLNPLVLERGADVDTRIKDVEAFWKGNLLNPNSNVLFGEGGAGTFSDGKLNTLVKDKFGRNQFVLKTLVEHGAPAEILYEQKPHIGTDILAQVVRRIRKSIETFGGEICFHTKVTDIFRKNPADDLTVQTSRKDYITDTVILAIGHSARDTFEMLYERGVPMLAKSFAVGLRIEHHQTLINESQYGISHDVLPPASYKLAEQLDNGRGVYSFCMCPGGYVVNASSEKNRLVVNGMSYYKRDGKNANSAIVVTVTENDYENDHPLSGMEFQRRLEERAYQMGNGKIPVQRFADFCEKQITVALGDVQPNIKGQWQFADLNQIFPKEIQESLKQGILRMDQKIKGFANQDALLSGVESRTSSPVKISRDVFFESGIKGIYPCGEGAGYAGGITSAAMDGMKVAEVVIHNYQVRDWVKQ